MASQHFDSMMLRLRKLEESEQNLHVENRALSQFSGMAAHDLKAPLRSLNIYHDLMREHFGEDIDEEMKEYLEDSQLIINKMKSLSIELL